MPLFCAENKPFAAVIPVKRSKAGTEVSGFTVKLFIKNPFSEYI